MTQRTAVRAQMSPGAAEQCYQRYLDTRCPRITYDGKEYSTSLALRKTDPFAYWDGLAQWAAAAGIAIEELRP